MADQFVSSREVFPVESAGLVWTFDSSLLGMHGSYVALKFSICSKWGLVSAIFDGAYQRVDVDVVEMLVEKPGGFMQCLRRTTVPSTSFARFPSIANIMGVQFDMTLLLFNSI